ncbi:MAG: cyclase family protein [Pyrinomonadaceae bacterium]|nr:cyclase family protein [Pyrinomonadaceae bacterium]
MKIYDITVPLSSGVPVYEGDPKVEITAELTIDGGDSANVSRLCCGVHTATHVDAPNHFIDGTRRVDELDLEKMIGKCLVVEVDKNVRSIEPEHLSDFQGAKRILFKTASSDFWGDPDKKFRRDFTYISPAAAKIIADSGVKLVGIDYLSVEKFGSTDFQTHLTLLEKEIVILEGLDLRKIDPGEYELICLPLKLSGGKGDGAPARAILRCD